MNRKAMLKKLVMTIVVTGLSYSIALTQEQRDLEKEVKVRTNYQPKINKAKRIGELPVVKDTASFTPSFEYFVQTRPLTVGFSPAEIPAAKIIGEPLQRLNSHDLTLAGGNYSTLFGDYRFNNQRSKATDIGLHLRHYSTDGKLKLEDGDKVKPAYSEQLVETYGTTYFDEGKVSGRLFYEHRGFNYYGFPQDGDVDASFVDLFPYQEQEQNNFGISADFQSAFKDEEKLNFGVGLKYERFSDDIDLKENDLLVSGNAKIRRGDGFWSIVSEFDYFSIDGLYHWENDNRVNERKTLVWTLRPRYLLQAKNVNLQLGVDAVLATGDDSKTKIYPDVKIDFMAIDGIISLFAGVNGGLKMNRFKEIAIENRYVYSGLNVLPTNQKYNLFGGIKGSLSSNASFTLAAGYSAIDNQYFFIQNDIDPSRSMLATTYSNKFGVVYDDISLFKLSAEVNLVWADKLDLNSKLTYNAYSMDVLEEAWHKPEFELEANALYKFTKELSFQAGVNILGERPVFVDYRKQTLGVIYDLNLGVNYRFSEHFSAFGKVNNLFADKYYQWDGYPSQGLNFLIGVKISL